MKIAFESPWVIDEAMTEDELRFYENGASYSDREKLCATAVERVCKLYLKNGVTFDDADVLILNGPSGGHPEVRVTLSGENENDVMMVFANAYSNGQLSSTFASNDEKDVVKDVKELFVVSVD